MRTFDKIIQELRQELNSPVWTNLKRGLLGQELINLAAHAVLSSDKGYSIFFRNFFPDTADLKGLLYQSLVHRVPIKNYRPSFIKIKMPGIDGKVYPPFSLVLQAGTIYYTNTTFVKDSIGEITQAGTVKHSKVETAIFYQGKVRCLTNIQESQLVDFGYRNVEYHPVTEQNHTKFSTDLFDSRTQIILPKYAFPESFKVFLELSQLPISEITGVNANSSSYAYCNYTDLDETQRLVFGNGETSKILPLQTPLAVYYLELSFREFNTTFVELSYPYATLLGDKIVLQESQILSQFDGEFESLEAARYSLIEGLSKYNTISTKYQIESFCKSNPTVLDAIIIDTSDNLIEIKVKPRTSTDTCFQGLETDLQLYGELVTQYRVSPAESLIFSIYLHTQHSVSESLKNLVEEQLNSRFAYHKIGFKESISEATISDIVRHFIGHIPFSVKLILQDELAPNIEGRTIYLDLQPVESSIKLIDTVTNELKAWDRDGRIVGTFFEEPFNFHDSFPLGDFILIKVLQAGAFKVFNPYTKVVTNIASSDNIQNVCSFDDWAICVRNTESGESRVSLYSQLGWRVADPNNVTQSSTALVKQGSDFWYEDSNGDPQFITDNTTLFKLSYFNFLQYDKESEHLYIPHSGSDLPLTINIFQRTGNNQIVYFSDFVVASAEGVSLQYFTQSFRVGDYYIYGIYRDAVYSFVGINFSKTLSDLIVRKVNIPSPHSNVTKFKVGRRVLAVDSGSEPKASVYRSAYIQEAPEDELNLILQDKLFEFPVEVDDFPLLANEMVTVGTSGSFLSATESEDFDRVLKGDMLFSLKDIGYINYYQKVISFNDSVKNPNPLNLLYQTSDSLSLLKEKYPLLKDNGIVWNS